MAYVEQEDSVLPTETPRESMNLSAKLRLPQSLSDEDREAIVEKVIRRLGLTKCADQLIGGRGVRGISGGTYSFRPLAFSMLAHAEQRVAAAPPYLFSAGILENQKIAHKNPDPQVNGNERQ